MVAFDELIKNYSCFDVNNQSCLNGLFSIAWFYLVVLIGYLFLKNSHDWTKITQMVDCRHKKALITRALIVVII